MAVAAAVMVGKAFTVTVNVLFALTQPVAFFTVSIPVYTPPAVPAGTTIPIELAVNVAFVTAAKLLLGVAFQMML